MKQARHNKLNVLRSTGNSQFIETEVEWWLQEARGSRELFKEHRKRKGFGDVASAGCITSRMYLVALNGTFKIVDMVDATPGVYPPY